MFDPPPDDTRHRILFRLIGQFIANWAHVEWNLAFLTSGLLRTFDMSRVRMILAAQINFRAKRELILRLGRSYLQDQHLPLFERTMGRVKHLSEKRNLLAHRHVHYLSRSTFRFFSDEDATQPNTFGRYTDVQLGTIRAWIKELSVLSKELRELHGITLREPMRLLPRVIPELGEDHSPSGDPHPDGDAILVPPLLSLEG